MRATLRTLVPSIVLGGALVVAGAAGAGAADTAPTLTPTGLTLAGGAHLVQGSAVDVAYWSADGVYLHTRLDVDADLGATLGWGDVPGLPADACIASAVVTGPTGMFVREVHEPVCRVTSPQPDDVAAVTQTPTPVPCRDADAGRHADADADAGGHADADARGHADARRHADVRDLDARTASGDVRPPGAGAAADRRDRVHDGVDRGLPGGRHRRGDARSESVDRVPRRSRPRASGARAHRRRRRCRGGGGGRARGSRGEPPGPQPAPAVPRSLTRAGSAVPRPSTRTRDGSGHRAASPSVTGAGPASPARPRRP